MTRQWLSREVDWRVVVPVGLLSRSRSSCSESSSTGLLVDATDIVG